MFIDPKGVAVSIGTLYRGLTRFTSGFVLAFHEIPPHRFIELIENLAPMQPVPLDEMVNRRKQGRRTSGLFAITVDDCFAENTQALVQTLEEKGWPATFYVPTGYVDSDKRMAFVWWRRLEVLLVNKVLHLKSGTLDCSNPAAIVKLRKKMESLWHTARPEAYMPQLENICNALFQQYGLRCDEAELPTVLDSATIAKLSQKELVRFESHGVTHSALSALDEGEIEAELVESKKFLRECTGRECRHFAYPFGSPQSIGKLAPAIAARHYESAATMSLGGVDGASTWLLPRIPLYEKTSRYFAHLKVLLKCNHLRLVASPSM